MKKRMQMAWKQLRTAVTRNPVEVLLAFFFCVLGCRYDYTQAEVVKEVIPYFPIFFLFTSLLNRVTAGKKGRIIYYISFGFVFPLFWIEPVSGSVTYWVSLIVVQFLYLASSRERENEPFIRFALRYLGAILSAGLLASIAWCLVLSIYYSVCYIFEIAADNNEVFMRYSTSILFFGMMPLLFLMFHSQKEEKFKENNVIQALLNYVLSPALLIYALILYLYFIKIAVLWSLPKGAVAFMVVNFVCATFILKGCQLILKKRLYDWFYHRASLAMLPALAMYWIGAGYRIYEYGFTEARVYLVAAGVILTGTTLLFFSRRAGRYLYAVWLGAAVLSVVTYIPGIKATDIERISQSKRTDSWMKETAYSEVTYLEIRNDGPVDCRGYTSIHLFSSYPNGESLWVENTTDSLFFYQNGRNQVWADHRDSLFMRQLVKAGLSLSDTIPQTLYPVLLEMEIDSVKYVFEWMSVRKDSTYHVSHITPAFYLKR